MSHIRPEGITQSADYFKRLGEQLVSGVSAAKSKTFADVSLIDQAVQSRGLTADQLTEMGREYAEKNPDAPVSPLQGQTVTTARQALALPDFPAITSEFLKTQGAINVPPTPTPTTPDIAGGRASIDSLNKLALSVGKDDSTSLFQQFLKSAEPPPSLADEFTKTQQGAGIPGLEQGFLDQKTTLRKSQSKLAGIQAELTGLQAEIDITPERIQQESIGRGRTVEGIAPLQAAELRKLALRAVPIQARALATQAEIFSAQGDLEISQAALKMANDKLNTLFDIRRQDAENTYNYWQNIRERVFEFLDKSEQRKIQQQQTDDDRKFTLFRDQLSRQQDIADQFLRNNQADLAVKVSQLDPTSASYEQELGGLQAQFRPKVETVGGLTPFQNITLRNQLEDNLRQNPAVKAYGELVNFGVPTVLNRFNQGQTDSVADTILMRTLAKVTDPTTGVREEEYRTFEDAQGALNRVFVLPQKWVGRGRLTAEGRAAMIREIQDRFESRLSDYNSQYQYYQNQATQAGVTIPPPYQVAQTKIEESTVGEDEAVFDEVVGTPAQTGGYFSRLWGAIMGR